MKWNSQGLGGGWSVKFEVAALAQIQSEFPSTKSVSYYFQEKIEMKILENVSHNDALNYLARSFIIYSIIVGSPTLVPPSWAQFGKRPHVLHDSFLNPFLIINLAYSGAFLMGHLK